MNFGMPDRVILRKTPTIAALKRLASAVQVRPWPPLKINHLGDSGLNRGFPLNVRQEAATNLKQRGKCPNPEQPKKGWRRRLNSALGTTTEGLSRKQNIGFNPEVHYAYIRLFAFGLILKPKFLEACCFNVNMWCEGISQQ